ncbi:MAG: penicillin-binding protein 2 [Clostridiales bacterium]|nr:penicillin-binding protein 2 [Clostridiales bacterium]MCF8021817.1 penicillin-binding protein 2 [Clostridiales bacterium]
MRRQDARKRIIALMVILGLIFAVLVGRLAYLQLVKVNRYKTLARENMVRIIPMKAPRGKIVDRNKKIIVTNKPEYALSLSFLGMSEKERQNIKKLLAQILSRDKSLELTAAEWHEKIEEKLEKQTKSYIPVRIVSGVSWNTVVEVKERGLDLPGVIVEEEPVRQYPHGDLLAHVAGYVRQINSQQLKAHQDEGYQLGDMYGQSGLEKSFEKYLRGEKGAQRIEVDAYGRPVNVYGVKKSIPGSDLVLTVDNRLQKAAEEALVEGIKMARENGHEEAENGSTVVMDVNSGAVLAMASYPSYNPEIFTGIVTQEELKGISLLNRAINAYPPGSVFKPVTGAAILENDIVNPDHAISDPGYYMLGSTRFNDWKPGGHGKVDFRKALQVSCNTYFYKYSRKVGHEAIAHYAREFGLGQKTGIRLPGEEKGLLPTLENKRKKFDKNSWEYDWHTYDTLNMGIGQGYSKYTPLQLANYVSSIANGGTLYKPYVVEKIVKQDGSLEKEYEPEIKKTVDVSEKTLQIIREGMHMVTQPGGTAAGVFWDFPIGAAAKTGSAEVGDHDTHALFASFVPYENPEIAVITIIEHGGSGSASAGPVARDILDVYLEINKDLIDYQEPQK